MIRLENIAKYYYSSAGVNLGLKKINLAFERGEFVVITGESGSGKTTLLNVISGMDTFEEGEMYINDQPVSAVDETFWEEYRRRHISFIYQDYRLIESYTALENVESVILMQGYTKKEAKKRAVGYLKDVGLYDRRFSRAAHLSSGQKQRLAIARALAKESEIIIADEPTGNLDAENGRMVMELLAECAKSRLVLVVTHNYEQTANLATRLIRLYRGQVSEDGILRPWIMASELAPESDKTDADKTISGQDSGCRKKNAGAFLRMNLLRQPVRNGFFFVLCLCLTLAFLVFIGIIFQNLDGAQARYYQENGYYNGDDTRILIRNRDGSELTEEDLAKIQNVRYVAQMEHFADISDVNYYYRYGEDYDFTYDTREGSLAAGFQERSINYLDNSNYMKSASCISNQNILAGKIPEGLYEIAVASKDESLIGTTVTVICADRRNWMANSFLQKEMTITGLVEGKDEQFYFSDSFCDMLNADTLLLQDADPDAGKEAAGLYDGSSNARTSLIVPFDPVSFASNPTRGVCGYKENLEERLEHLLNMMRDYEEEGYYESAGRFYSSRLELWNEQEDYDFMRFANSPENSMIHRNMLLVIDESLEGNEVILSSDFYNQHLCSDAYGNLWVSAVPYNILYGKWNEETEKKDYYRMEVKHETGEDGTITGPESDMGIMVICVSQEFFDTINPDRHITQAEVYIEDYAYTDRVIKQLTGLGYEAVSVFRISSSGYDKEVVIQRLVSVCMAAGALLALFFLGVMLLALMMKSKQNDDTILHGLGMEQGMIRKINILYFAVMLSASGVIAVSLMYMLSYAGVEKVTDLQNYYGWPQFVIYVILLAAFTALLGKRYMRLWRAKSPADF